MTAAQARSTLEIIVADAKAAIADFDSYPDEGIPQHLLENIERNARCIRTEYNDHA